MTFWQRLGYVARRLGREFLILGIAAVVLIFVANYAMLKRLENTVGRYNRQATENAVVVESMRQNPVSVRVTQNRLPEVLEIWSAFRANLDLRMSGPVRPRVASGRDWIRETVQWNTAPPTRFIQAYHHPDKYDAFMNHFAPLLRAPNPGDGIVWPPDNPGVIGAEDQLATKPTDFEVFKYVLGHLSRAAAELGRSSYDDEAIKVLIALGPMWEWSRQESLERRIELAQFHESFLAALLILLKFADLETEEIDALLPVVVAIRGHQVDVRLAEVPQAPVPANFARVYGPFHRRAYEAYRKANYLRAQTELGACLLIADYSTRTRAYAAAYDRYAAPILSQGIFHPSTLNRVNTLHIRTAECDVIALMLTLEKHHNMYGTYPDSLESLDYFPPPGLDPELYATHPIEYRPREHGYTLSREMYHLNGDDDTRVWRRMNEAE